MVSPSGRVYAARRALVLQHCSQAAVVQDLEAAVLRSCTPPNVTARRKMTVTNMVQLVQVRGPGRPETFGTHQPLHDAPAEAVRVLSWLRNEEADC